MPGGAAAPTADAPAPIVEEISLIVLGPQQISTEAIRAHILQREKAPYDQELVDKSVESLQGTKQFNFVRTDRDLLPSGGVRLVIRLAPNPRLTAVVFKGNKTYSQARLFEEVKTVAGEIADPQQLQADKLKLIEFYQKKGFMQVKVDANMDTNENTGTAVATFDINEGPDVEISDIIFTGNDHVSGGILADQIETVTHKFIISWFTGGGVFKKDQFLDDLDALRKYYKSKGYLDVRIVEEEIKYDYPAPGKLVLTIPVHEGTQYHVGKSIRIIGNTIFPVDALTALLTIKTGDVFSPEEIDKNKEAIRDFYGKAGYLDTFVRADRLPDSDAAGHYTGDMGVDFVIMHPLGDRVAEGESEKFYVEDVEITGNKKTRSTVIVRELVLAPGDVFDTDRMKTSEDRLKGTGYFEEVNLTPGETNIPGKRNLRVNVTEAKTFQASIGAGFDPVEGVAAFVEFQESNFDLFNSRTGFRGGGQKAHVKLTVGSKILSVQLDYEYPWLFERRLDAGISLFHSENGYYSDTYNENDTGFTVFVRKPVIEFIDATLGYTLEDIFLKDITTSAPPPVQAEAGHTSASIVSLDLVRQKGLDSPLSPTRGERQEFLTSVGGGPIGGQMSFYKLDAHVSWWFPISTLVPMLSYGNQVLSLSARLGTIDGYDGKGVPYAQRFFLGGDYDMRGYSIRWVGPHYDVPGPAFGEPLGGNSRGLVQTEYSFELFKDFRFAVFHDIGFVNVNSYDFDPRHYRQDVGFGIRFLLMRQPIRIDFGYPLNPDQFQSHSFRPSFSLQAIY